MSFYINKSILFGSIKAPPSKSYTHRFIFLGALGHSKTNIYYPLISQDVISTITCCSQLGAIFEFKDLYTKKKYNLAEFLKLFYKNCLHHNNFKISLFGFNGKPKINNNIFELGNSGTTLRFLIGISLLINEKILIDGDSSLRSRPNNILLKAIENIGIKSISCKNNGNLPIVIFPIKSMYCNSKYITRKINMLSISGSISSQYISSLFLVAPLLRSNSIIEIKKPIVSRSYILMTLQLLKINKINIFLKEENEKK